MKNQRINTYATKYLRRKELFGDDSVIPLWIADMDLPGSEAITKALVERAQHSIWGYTVFPDEYYQAFIRWQQRRNGVEYDQKNMSYANNLVQGILFTLGSLLEPGDKVVVQPPVYTPFFSTIHNNQLQQLDNPLRFENERYQMDFDQLDEVMQEAKAMILCNPHNPVGRNWTEAELQRVVDLARKHDIYILSDEIHSDFIHQGTFTPLKSLDSERVITLNSTGKSFNTAGIQGGYVIFPNEEMKARYDEYADAHGRVGPNAFNVFANIAAYNESEEWLEQTLQVIRSNMEYTLERIKNEAPRIKAYFPEATYLLWLDFTDFGLSDEALKERLVEAGVGLGAGHLYGPGGSGHMRLNIATPPEVLAEAMDRIVAAFG